MLNRVFFIAGIFLVMLLMINPDTEAKTIIVDKDGEGDYLTIQDGMIAAAEGDTVTVHSGTYYEYGIHMKNNVTLIGAGAESCKIHGGDEFLPWPNDAVIKVDSISQCKIEGFTLTYKGMGIMVINSKADINNNIMDSCFTAVFCRYNSEVEMLNNLIINCKNFGIGILDTSKITLISNIIYHAICSGIEIIKNSQGEIINNVLHENGPYGLRVAYGSKCTVYNTIIWHQYSYSISSDSDLDSILIEYSDIQRPYLEEPWEGTGNICADPMFLDYPSYDFHLHQNSPCINSGNPEPIYNDVDGSRNDIGAFGGPYGSWLVSDVDDNTLPKPTIFGVFYNFPNPFNTETTIQFLLNQYENVKLTIYNISGQKILALIDGKKASGLHSIKWNGYNENGDVVPSGVYICRLELINDNKPFSKTLKLIMLK